MSDNWENKFTSWANPPSQTELAKGDNAISVIRKAIDASPPFDNRNIKVIVQGSYRNRTNVRADSDVDICVLCRDSIFFALPEGMSASDFGIDTPADYSYTQYKNELENALVGYLGRDAVVRGSKAFDIHENTYRMAADVVACFEYRLYNTDNSYREGTSFVPDNGYRIVNWPEQNYNNGITKNDNTGRRFKAIVRILKCLRNEMAESTEYKSKTIPSYLIECLLWNAQNKDFGNTTYTEDVRQTIIDLYNNMKSTDTCKEWGEINDIKYLFRPGQPWTLQQANDFIVAVWSYVGYE